MPTLTISGMGIIPVCHKCDKGKCKKRSAKVYRLARNRGKTVKTPEYNAVSVYTGDRDDVYMEDDTSTQHEEDSVLTGVKQKLDHEVEAKSATPCPKTSTSCYNTGRYKVTFKTHYVNLLHHFLDSVFMQSLRLRTFITIILLIKISQVDIGSRLI